MTTQVKNINASKQLKLNPERYKHKKEVTKQSKER